MSETTLNDERKGFYFHQGCTINGELCRLNRYYEGCKKCIKFIPGEDKN